MKRLILAVITASLSVAAPAFAQDEAKVPDICASMGQLAENIMKRRQEGTPPSTLRAAFAGNKVEDLAVSMVEAAYERPRFSTDEMQLKEVQNFRAESETSCYKAFKKP